MKRLAIKVLLNNPWEAAMITAQGTVYTMIVPDRRMLARLLRVPGYDRELTVGLNGGAPSAGRVGDEFRKVLQSPALTAFLLFQMAVTVLVWAGIGRALLWCIQGSAEYRMWIMYLTAVALLFIFAAAGGEASVRFRVPVVPLLAIVAALGFFPAAKPSA
jgi:hypothetical protein